MNTNHWLLIAIVILPFIPVMLNRLRIDLAALAMAVCLGILQLMGFGLLGPAHTPADAIKAISGFSEPVVITLLSLFILTRGLEKSGGTRWLTRIILRIGRNDERRLIFSLSAFTALLSLFMNNLAAGALMLPIAMEASRRTGVRPSKLLIPVAYGSLLGGSATYFTTANIIMSNLLTVASPPQTPLNILDFTPTGGLIAISGILFITLFGKRLLPIRQSLSEMTDARLSVTELEKLYSIGERLWEACVTNASPLIGKTVMDSQIGGKFGVTIAAIQKQGTEPFFPAFNTIFQEGDRLTLIGREEKIIPLQELGLIITSEKQVPNNDGKLGFRGLSYFEIILAPHSSLEGKTLKQIDFRQKFGVSIVALQRRTRSYRTDVGDIPLEMGDSLLALGKSNRAPGLRTNSDFILIEPSLAEEPVDKRRAFTTFFLIAAGIAASISGVPIYLAMLTAAVISLFFQVTHIEETYKSIEWQAIFLIAGMYAVSLAMVETGLASILGETVIRLALPFGALGLAAGAYLLTALLTQFLGGQVAALVTGPITISAAITMGVNPQAVAVATAIGCSASFLTPLAHPVNILMIAPANYRFGDFFRTGWPLTLLSFGMLLIGLILFWHL